MTDKYGWPDKLKPIDIEKLSKPLRKAFLQAVSLKKKQPTSITYAGPEVTNNLGALAVGPGAKERLQPSSLEYNKERGRDSLEVLILLALQLGMEQGMRLFKERNVDYGLLETYRETILRQSEELKQLKKTSPKSERDRERHVLH